MQVLYLLLYYLSDPKISFHANNFLLGYCYAPGGFGLPLSGVANGNGNSLKC